MRIGDPDITFDDPRHTYVLEYTLGGALHTYDGEPELFWDLNSEHDTPVRELEVRVTAPGGVQEARCLVGELECAASIDDDGVARYRATDVSDIASVVAALEPGSVDDAEADLVRHSRSRSLVREPAPEWIFVPVFLIIWVFMGFWGGLSRTRPRHERWADVAPGTFDPGGPTAPDPGPAPAVRFDPPDATLVEVGRACDITAEPRHLTATLVQMAVDGHVTLTRNPVAVARVPGSVPADPVQRSLYELLPETNAPTALDEGRAKRMRAVLDEAAPDGDLSLTTPTSRSVWDRLRAPVVLIPVGAFAVWLLGLWWGDWLVSLPVMLAVAFGLYIGIPRSRNVRGPERVRASRTARGSALWAQAEGFRQYLATAEAAQLDVEADQGIYRRFLPWAVLFGLTKRWLAVGEELRASGRVSDSALSVGVVGLRGAALGESIMQLERRSRPGSSSGGGHGSGSGGRSGRSSRSRGGGGGGGSRSRSW